MAFYLLILVWRIFTWKRILEGKEDKIMPFHHMYPNKYSLNEVRARVNGRTHHQKYPKYPSKDILDEKRRTLSEYEYLLYEYYALLRKKNVKEYQEAYTKKNRALVSSKAAVRTRTNRKTLIELMGSATTEGRPICECCGEDDLIYLQVDHVNNDGFKDKKGNKQRNKITVSQYLENPKRFQLLCANCNYTKHKNGGKLYKPKKR